MTSARSWRNWARNQICEPAAVATPGSADEVAALVTDAARRGRRVKPVGAGHSFTATALTDGLQLDLRRLSGLVGVEPTADGHALATVRAGTTLAHLNRELAVAGFALENLGDIDRQTIAGALATGTHGTGAGLGGLASQVTALALVTADGTLRRCDRERGGDLFDAARVGLGALGVVTEVTVRCPPAFLLRAAERPARLAATLAAFDETVASHDHVEFYWFPHTDRVQTKINDRVSAGRPRSRARVLIDDELLANGAFRVLNEAARVRPALVPTINRLSARGLTARSYTEPSHRVFTSPRRVRFLESEYAVPRSALPSVLVELRAWLDGHDERVAFPVEVRVAAADDAWLSTGYQRENAYVAVHQFNKRDHRRYFAAFEAIVAEHAGRPHWGKLHTLDADRLAALYPRHADFVNLRDRLDPGRTFGNGYLHSVLG